MKAIDYFTLQKIFLALTILALPFDSIPREWTISLIGSRLSVYFVILALVTYFIQCIKEGFKNNTYPKFLIYIAVYIVWQEISLINGLWHYEFPNFLYNFQSEKFAVLLQTFPFINEIIDKAALVKVYLFLRLSFNQILIPTITYLGLTYLIYHWYKKEQKNLFFPIRKIVFCLAIACGIYSILEVALLKFDSVTARNLLEIINPYFYDIGWGHGWWPPLIWDNQLRSLCTEPSFFGILSAFIIPFLWSYCFEKITLRNVLLTVYFTILIFLTRARTATLLYFGEAILLYIWGFVICRNKMWIKTIGSVTLITIVAFSLNIVDYKELMMEKSVIVTEQSIEEKSYLPEKETADEYVKNNVLSVTDSKTRSNGARIINLAANYRVFKEHLIFGVGRGLKNAYIAGSLTSEDLKNYEVKNWYETTYKVGPFKSEFPVVNNFVNILAQEGIIGFIIWLLPIIYLFIQIIKYWPVLHLEYSFVLVGIGFASSVAAMLSNNVWPTYYILLGMLLAVCDYCIKIKEDRDKNCC